MFLVLYLLKRGRLNLRYTLAWLFSCGAMFIVLLFPSIAAHIAYRLGIVEVVNAVFLLQGLLVMLILLSLTAVVSRLNEKSTRIIQQVALLEERLRTMEERSNVPAALADERNLSQIPTEEKH